MSGIEEISEVCRLLHGAKRGTPRHSASYTEHFIKKRDFDEIRDATQAFEPPQERENAVNPNFLSLRHFFLIANVSN